MGVEITIGASWNIKKIRTLKSAPIFYSDAVGQKNTRSIPYSQFSEWLKETQLEIFDGIDISKPYLITITPSIIDQVQFRLACYKVKVNGNQNNLNLARLKWLVWWMRDAMKKFPIGPVIYIH